MSAKPRQWSARGVACLAVVLGCACAQVAQAAGAGFSWTPSKTEPYAVCGLPTRGHSECLSILVPASATPSLSATPSVSGQLPPAVIGPSFSGHGVGGGYDPADLQSAYGLPSASAGAGQTVAIVDAFDDPNAESDLGVYRAKYGLSECTSANGCFKKASQTGSTTKLPKAEAGWAVEISTDLDMASAACPKCHLLLVEAENNENTNLDTAEDEAATLGATEISNSYGGEEASGETSDDSFFNHPGVLITASAGDSGYGVEYPASSHNVIAVGGTALTPASNKRGWTETAWSKTGSGCSAFEEKPAWQTDKGCSHRTNNDVAAVASQETPVSVADSYKLPKEFSSPEPGWTLVAGTSVASPFIAGTLALSNAYTKSFAAAHALYMEAAQNGTGVLDDVTSGSDGSCSGSYLCTAGTGYDGPTGLGSPYGAPIVIAAPTVKTEKASEIGQTTAKLNASVNPNGGEVTECKLEYGPTASYGESMPCSPSPGSGESAVAVSASLSGLSAKSTYHFRIVAKNAGGESKGADETFETLNTTSGAPTVKTEKASEVAQTTAKLNASVNPNGGEVTECKLEYGPTASYGESKPCSPSPGSGESPVSVSASLSGLSAKSTYHFRVVAKNAGGESKGADETLKTLPNAPTVKTEKASEVAQTTAKLNASVNPNGGEVTECKLEYGPTASYGESKPCSPSPGSGESAVTVSASLSGLSAKSTYHFRVVAKNAGGESKGADETLKTLPNAPTVKTEKASEVAQTTAKLNASVNPNGGEVTECKLEYGPTASYGESKPCSPSPGSGESAVTVSASLSGLSAKSTYHFRVVAKNAGGESKGSDETFETLTTTSEAPTVKTEKASEIAQTTAKLNASVNPNGGEVTECKLEYGPTASYGESKPCSPSPGSGESAVTVSASLSGLSAKSTYHFRVVAKNAGGESKGSDETLKTLPNAPTVKTEKASEIAQTTAKLNASVNPNGGEVTECKLEYGPTASYGESKPCSPSPGSGESAVTVSASLSGLSAKSTYHFRVVAKNAGGESKGSDETLKTLPNAPTVKTEKASEIAQTTAKLNASVNPNGGEVTECKLEYGPTASYGESKPCSPSPGSGESAVTVSASISGLTANATYHFRIVAKNAGGESKGADETLKTTSVAPTVKTEKASEVAQTTAKLSATVNPNGGEVTNCEFEYVTAKHYEFYGYLAANSIPCSSLPGSGSGAVSVSATVPELFANTTYHFRIVAKNAGGESEGADETFKTLPYAPGAEAERASEITQTSAQLNGFVGPEGAETVCRFEYGTTPAYGSSKPCTPPPGSTEGVVSESAAVSGLSADTTYFFRIVAENAGGKNEGRGTFTTLPAPSCTAEGFCNNLSHFQGEASFSEPDAVALDPSGDIFVADSAKDQVLEFNSERKLLRQFGSEGSGEGQFKGIGAIASNSAGDVYVTDPGNHRVQEFGPSGEHLRSFGSSALKSGQLLDPTGIAIDSSGDVWVLNPAGASGDRIVEFSSEGGELTKFGANGSGEGQLGQAYGLAISGGNLYVSEQANSRVQELSTAGAFIRQFDLKGSGSGESNQPYAIATEAGTGDLYVTEVGSARVQVFSAEGAFVTTFGSPGSGAGSSLPPRA